MKEHMFDGVESPSCPRCKSTGDFRLLGYRGLGLLLRCDQCNFDFVESLKVVGHA